MKDIGLARKKRGGYGKANARQHVLFEEPPLKSSTVPIGRMVLDTESDISSGVSSSSTPTAMPETSISSGDLNDVDDSVPRAHDALGLIQRSKSSDHAPIMACLSPYRDYDRARLKFGVDLMDLSILTNFHVGKYTIAILSADPSRLASLLGQYQWSYLEFVPPRYGSTECLTAATDCLLARVHNVLAPNKELFSICNRLYGKALQALQGAIANESLVMKADVLCATQLLSLVEVRAGLNSLP